MSQIKKPKKPVLYQSATEPLPEGDSPKHLYEVQLLILDDANLTPDDVLNHVMSACLQHPKITAVVNGYGAKVNNVTLSNPKNRAKAHARFLCVGITNVKVPKKATEIPMIRVK